MSITVTPQDLNGETHRERSAVFSPRQRQRSGHRAHSRIVGLLRVMLPLMVMGILGLILVWPQLRDATFQAPVVGITASGGDTTILAPRYEGVDSGGQPYRVTAERAIRPGAESGILNLIAPEADMTLRTGRDLNIVSDDARYNESTEDLVMWGNVRLIRDDGYVFDTEEAHANVGEQRVWGDHPVTGSGPAGTIEAEGFRIDESGNTIIFTGQSRLVLFQRRGEPSE